MFAYHLLGITVVFAIAGLIWNNWPTVSLARKKLQGSYDYIIVGAGTAGSVLAARLSEIPGAQVLLIEAGGEETKLWVTQMPLAAMELQRTVIDWAYQTTSQRNACKSFRDEKINVPSGKVLGGTSSINYMLYSRGSKYDYDGWFASGCEGWKYEDVMPYFLKSEGNQYQLHSDSKYHRRKGPLTVSNIKVTPLGDTFVKAGISLGHKQTDINGEEQLGVSPAMGTVKFGRRVSSATAFLRPVIGRRNLHVTIESTVTKILTSNGVAYAVQLIRNGTLFQIKARKEVILCAGAINSPKILMNSGIGPKDHLDELGIGVVADLPVGENLQDHVWVPGIEYLIKRKVALTDAKAKAFWSLADYMIYGQGLLSSPGVEAVGFFRSRSQPQNESFPYIQLQLMPTIHATAERRDKQMAAANIMNWREEVFRSLFGNHANKDGFTLMPILLHSRSRGTVRLKSADPFESPLIDPNYLADERDVEILYEAIRLADMFAGTFHFQSIGTESTFRVHQSCREHKTYSKEYWYCYIRHNTFSMFHFVGTCKMGAKDDRTAVVDPQLRVRGIKNLRVVDASVIPLIPSGNPAAVVVMVAERAADLIRGTVTVPAWGGMWPEQRQQKHHDEFHDEL